MTDDKRLDEIEAALEAWEQASVHYNFPETNLRLHVSPADVRYLLARVRTLEADYERQHAILVTLAQQGLVHMTGVSTTTADSSAGGGT